MKRHLNLWDTAHTPFRAFTIILTLSLLLFTSCSPEIEILEESFISNRAELSGNSQNIQVLFDSKAGTASIELKANMAWQAEFLNSRATWCSLSAETGKRGTAKLTISVTENTTYEERSATIALNCKDAKVIILVIQKQNDAVLLSSSKIEAPASGGVFKIDVRHNIDYSLSLAEETESWITIVGTKALTTSSVSLKVAANDEISKREGHIIMKSNLGEEIIRVYQDGAAPVLVLSQNSYTLPDDGGVISVEVKSNVNYQYEIREGADWITEVETKSMSTHTLVFGIKANETYDDRTGRILFTDKETGLEEEVMVFQKQKDALLLTQKEYTLTDEGQIITVEVNSNVEFKYYITEGSEWISELKTKGLNTHVIQFDVKPNDGYDKRTGKIVFSDEICGLSEDVTIIQEQKNALFVNVSSLEVPPQGSIFPISVSSNVSVGCSIPDTCSWIRQVQTKGLSEQVFEFEAERNHTREERTGVILFQYHEICDTVVIRQTYQPIVISEKTLYFSGRGSIASFLTAAGKMSDYRIEISDSWLSMEQKQPVAEGIEFTLSAQENPQSSQREGVVKVYFQDYSEPDTVKVIQMEKYPMVTFTTWRESLAAPTLFGQNTQGFISWGDGITEQYLIGATHNYLESGEHTVSIEANNLKGIHLPAEHQMRVDFKELTK